MSYQLQIAIPLFVTFAALATIAIVRKYIKIETFVIGLAVLGFAVFMTAEHISADSTSEAVTEVENIAIEMDTFSLNLANRYMLDGQYDAALEVLNDLTEKDGGNTKYQLATARCLVLQKNYTAAVPLYRKASPDSEECQMAQSLLVASTVNSNATVSYLKDQGYDPTVYGLREVSTGGVKHSEVASLIQEQLKDDMEEFEDEYGDDIMETIQRASSLTAEFSAFLKPDFDGDKSSAEALLEKLEGTVKSIPVLNDNLHLRLARLKGYVVTGDYSKIARMINRTVVAEELVILSQLLVSDLISEGDFSNSYINSNTKQYSTVLKACEETLNQQKKKISEEKFTLYSEKIEQLKEQLANPVLFTLRQDLLKEAQEGDPKMQSKCYLSLAKIENAYGSAKQADVYISDALGTAANSDDENYSIPMNQMTSIIQGNTETSEIKNIADYVDTALDHSLPMDVTVSQITTSETGSLNNQMTEDITKYTATLNIGVIDVGEFPTVSARVQIQSSKWTTFEEIKEHLNVFDCGSEITDFTLEKLEFQSSKIILLCDCSGSMSGSVDSLKQVVRDFAACMEKGEEICLVGFESDISFVKEFSGDKDEVAGFADSLYASGGTALFKALLYAGDLHTPDINANNIIIAMTDGQDGSPAGQKDMYDKIGAMAAEKGLTVYTVGLGDVDTDYLTFMAECGNGSFLYAKNDDDLQAFYDFIHGQLNNQYILTFTAKNQTKNERTLELSMDEEVGSKTKTYYLQKPSYSDEDSSAYNPYTVVDSELSIAGLSEKFLYKSSQDQVLKLRGTGFDAGDDITIRLIGNVKYNLEATFVDAESYTITIPSAVATGVYDLEVSIAGNSVTLKSELTISVSGNRKIFTYGSYNFTAGKSYINDNGDTVLTDRVILNGWLYFKGDVTIRYDYQDSGKAIVTDHGGFYVSYTDALATGLAQFVANKGIPISFDALGSFDIYPDPYTPGQFKDFPVDETGYEHKDKASPLNLLLLTFEDFTVGIYPDMLRLQGMSFNFKLPFQEQLLRKWDFMPKKAIDFDSDCLIGATEIALVGKLEYKDFGEDKAFIMVSLPLTIEEFSIEVDTLNNDYKLEANVGLEALNTENKLNFSFGVVGGKFDSIGLGLESDKIVLPLMTSPVPVSMKNFGFELSDLSKLPPEEYTLPNILAQNITIKFDVNAANLADKFPKIAKLIDGKDPALATLKDCKLNLQLKNFRISFDAKLVFATVIDLGEVHISAGKFDYTNQLIGYYNEEEVGLQVAVKAKAIDWHSANIDVEVTGKVEACLGYPYSGLWLNGTANFEVDFWIFSKDWDVSGDILIGAYKNRYGHGQFSIIVRGQKSNGNYTGFHAYVTDNTGFDVYKY